jgi:hypothetical protein
MRSMMRRGAGVLCLLLVEIPAAAQDSDLLRCRTIEDAAQRLACYDRIGVATEPPRRSAVEQFGLPPRPAAHETDAIESTLADDVDVWGPNDMFRLANGQVWQVVDDSEGYLRPGTKKVTIRRGALGAFYIEFEGTTRTARVRRVR